MKGRAPKTGYARDQFGPAWTDTDQDGCDQRNDVLRRDLTALHTKPGTNGCVLASGELLSPYTGARIAFRRGVVPVSVQIDHVVALGDAWQTGAEGWTKTTRTQFANDPLNLLAVDSFSNESKGDGDAATWLPAHKSYRCSYVARQVAVKARYHLWVTSAERDAIGRLLSSCPKQTLPATAAVQIPTPRRVGEPTHPDPRPSAAPTHRPTAPPAPAKKATASKKAAPSKKPKASKMPTRPARTTPPRQAPTVVHPGAFCSPAGARGVTDRGTPMVCSVKAGADQARWRHS